MRRKLVVAVVVVVAAGACAGVFSLRPEPASPELRGQEFRPTTRASSARPTAFAQGRVVDVDGAPAPGIQVVARDEDDREVTLLTDAEGRFAFEELRTPAWLRTAWDTPSAPTVVGVRKPVDDIEFVLTPSCPLEVRVTGADEATIEAVVTMGPQGAASAETHQGVAHLDLPCGIVRVEAFAPGFPSAIGDAWTFDESELTLEFEHGLRIYGTVTDQDGLPVEDATMWGKVWAISDAEGYYSALIEPTRVVFFSVESEFHRSEKEVLYVPDGTVELRHDVELESAHLVEVYCAGLEDDSCAELAYVTCTHPNSPIGAWCWEYAGGIECRCPEGEAAVRGGGVSVLVGPDEDVAWLDLRTAGSVRGRVVRDGTPVDCTLEATRFALSADLGLRMSGCDDDGVFELDNLAAGSWRLEVKSGQARRVVGPIDVDGPVDLGDVDLDGGGRIEGLVLSELGEEPVSGVSIAAVGLDALESGTAPPTGTDRTDGVGVHPR